MSFESLGLAPDILRAVAAEGYETPTPIQAQAIPPLLEGRDLLGCAQTGTGKTAAFALPILHRLVTIAPQKPAHLDEPQALSQDGRFHENQHGYAIRGFNRTRHAPKYKRSIRALILSPTRELTSQIAESLHTYGRNTRLRHVCIYGGVNQGPQVRMLQQGVDIVVATPGRLCDLIQQGWIDLAAIEMFVLDEADRMLDMGFLPDLRRISDCLPKERQTMLFSATMPGPIRELADKILHEPTQVSIAPQRATTELIEQQVYHVSKAQKVDLLTELLKRPGFSRTIVFTQTKHGADRVVKQLTRADIRAEAIHGNKSQNARQRALGAFKSSHIQVLVATDVAARGIDVDNISHVIQYDLPMEAETYVHRIGRTGRAGATGLAITFCDQEQRTELRDVERLINRKLDVMTDHPDGIEVLQHNPQPRAAKPNPPGKFRFGGAVRGQNRFNKPRREEHREERPRHAGRPEHRPGEERRERRFDDRRSDERPRSAGQRPDGPRAERPRADGSRSEGQRPQGSRPQGERSFGDRARADRPQGARSQSARAGATRTEGTRTEGQRLGKTYGGFGKFKFKAKRRPAAAK